jgi:hypothetical protein
MDIDKKFNQVKGITLLWQIYCLFFK